jgi:hypothetical protein
MGGPNFGAFPFTNSGFTNLAIALGGLPFAGSTLNGNALNDLWRQKSTNWALFTHDIISILPTVDLTLGARYTHEKKTLHGDLSDNLVLCGFFSDFIPSLQQLPCVSPTVGPAGLAINDSRSENKLSGTAVLSWKPELLAYASYSRGYKAGGFNLDRAALLRANGSGAVCVTVGQPGCGGLLASGADLEFKPETNDAFEVGAKYNGHGFDLNVAVFHELFRNFQLNTFNGLNFVVENINACKNDLGGADTDNNPATGACTGGTKAGVRSQGVEIEAFTRPMRYLNLNAGVTYADTKYRNNLVGANGRPLTNALFQLPGRRVSNANLWTLTGAAAWTPPIGDSGLSALVYADARYMSSLNTGSDLDLEKVQKGFTVVNGRIGIRGRNNSWSVELWAQNLFNEKFEQVAFDAPTQGSGTERGVLANFYPRSTQLYGSFLGEPRTFGVTLRAAFSPPRAAPAYVPPPPPPPPPAAAPATQGRPRRPSAADVQYQTGGGAPEETPGPLIYERPGKRCEVELGPRAVMLNDLGRGDCAETERLLERLALRLAGEETGGEEIAGAGRVHQPLDGLCANVRPLSARAGDGAMFASGDDQGRHFGCELGDRGFQVGALRQVQEFALVGEEDVDPPAFDEPKEIGAVTLDDETVGEGEGDPRVSRMGDVDRRFHGRARLLGVPEISFQIDDLRAFDRGGVDGAAVELLGGAEKGVHGPLRIGGDENQRSRGRSNVVPRRNQEVDPQALDIVAVDVAELVARHLADEGGAAAERGEARGRVAGRSAAEFAPRPHRAVEPLRFGLVDQAHRALGQALLGQEGVSGIGNHVDDGIADRQHINGFFVHRGRLAATTQSSNLRGNKRPAMQGGCAAFSSSRVPSFSPPAPPGRPPSKRRRHRRRRPSTRAGGSSG